MVPSEGNDRATLSAELKRDKIISSHRAVKVLDPDRLALRAEGQRDKNISSHRAVKVLDLKKRAPAKGALFIFGCNLSE